MQNPDQNKIYALLKLPYQVVGVKFTYSPEEFDSYQAVAAKKPIRYCCAVRSAMRGNSVKFVREMSSCPASTRALGLCPPDERFYSGEEAVRLGLYQDTDVAKAVAAGLPLLPPGTYGIVVKPLERFETEPNVVLIACGMRDMMRIAQGYSYTYGVCQSMSLCGNQAVCVECTSTPYRTGEINASALCSGTRHNAGWEEEIGMVGLPYAKFHGTVEGILHTVNAIEYDDRKREIYARLREMGCMTIEERYGETYFMKSKPRIKR